MTSPEPDTYPLINGPSNSPHQRQPLDTGRQAHATESWADQRGNDGDLAIPPMGLEAVEAQIDWGSFEWLGRLDFEYGTDLQVSDSDRDHLYVHRVPYPASAVNSRERRATFIHTLMSQSNSLFHPSTYFWLRRTHFVLHS